MSVSKENLIHHPPKNTATQQEATETYSEVPWKVVLKEILGTSTDRRDSQLSWANFSEHLRQLCPETQWIFIRHEDKEMNEGPMIQSMKMWLETLINDPSWPIPERVIIAAEGEGKKRSWLVSFPRNCGALPRHAPATTSLTVAPWGDEHSHGWKIHNIKPYTLNKTGEA